MDGDGRRRNQNSQRHPILDMNAENVESLDKHMQGRFPGCGAARLLEIYHIYTSPSTATNTTAASVGGPTDQLARCLGLAVIKLRIE